MPNDPTKETLEMREVTRRIRLLVRRLLEREAPAQDVSFALGYIAVELGLVLGNDAARVFPTVLAGASQAADVLADQQRQAEEAALPDRAPAGVPLHESGRCADQPTSAYA